MKNFHFSGYATKNDLKCSDGRTIRKDAFKECDGLKVPLVWQHVHDDPTNVLGHAVLENRKDGVYAYCTFNETANGKHAKTLVENGDITSLSIYANGLVQKGTNVVHGVIREVSLVLAGANPGATIDNLSVVHADGSQALVDNEAVIYSGVDIEGDDDEEEVEHADSTNEEDQTVGEVFDTLSEIQKQAVYAIIAEVATDRTNEDNTAQHSDEEGEQLVMKKNVFDMDKKKETQEETLTHAQFAEILSGAQKCGSFKESFLTHAVEYGIENIDYLFPDAQNVTDSPIFIKRDTGWVGLVLNGTRHTPFSRIKSLFADITAEDARARGYVKGNLKKDEIISLLKRVTTPTTVYKKQKLDRDDIVDITGLDVVAWLKSEMRLMLDEELARAVLVGDGRETSSEDKIKDPAGAAEGAGIRSIYKDATMYSVPVRVASTATAADFVEAIIRAMASYKGSGNPTLFTTSAVLTDMLLLKDKNDRRIYMTQTELESALRVSKIVAVPVMDNLKREDTGVTYDLLGIIVNLTDYTIGADRGGSVGMFDDFDIDYNQYKYLIETRCSGALTVPASALIIEQAESAG